MRPLGGRRGSRFLWGPSSHAPRSLCPARSRPGPGGPRPAPPRLARGIGAARRVGQSAAIGAPERVGRVRGDQARGALRPCAPIRPPVRQARARARGSPWPQPMWRAPAAVPAAFASLDAQPDHHRHPRVMAVVNIAVIALRRSEPDLKRSRAAVPRQPDPGRRLLPLSDVRDRLGDLAPVRRVPAGRRAGVRLLRARARGWSAPTARQREPDRLAVRGGAVAAGRTQRADEQQSGPCSCQGSVRRPGRRGRRRQRRPSCTST